MAIELRPQGHLTALSGFKKLRLSFERGILEHKYAQLNSSYNRLMLIYCSPHLNIPTEEVLLMLILVNNIHEKITRF